jgi:hypothetical protein
MPVLKKQRARGSWFRSQSRQIDLENTQHKKKLVDMFIAGLSTIAKLWKQPRCPTTDEWTKKMWYFTQP